MDDTKKILKKNLFYMQKVKEFVSKKRITVSEEMLKRMDNYLELKERLYSIGEEIERLKEPGPHKERLDEILRTYQEFVRTHIYQKWLEREDEKDRFLLWFKENSEVEDISLMELETNLNIFENELKNIRGGIERVEGAEAKEEVSEIKEEAIRPSSESVTTTKESVRPVEVEKRVPPPLSTQSTPPPPSEPSFIISERDRAEMEEADLIEKRAMRLESEEREQSDRRVFERVPISRVLSYTSEDQLYVGWSSNISEGGIFIATYSPLQIGATVNMVLQLPDGVEFEVEGEVRWIKEETEDVRITPGMGVKFLNLTPDKEKLLKEYVQKRKEAGGGEPIFFDDEL